MRLLLTGAAGFIGSNFVRMISRGEFPGFSSVTVLDKLTYAGDLTNLEGVQNLPSYSFIEGDICNSKLVTTLLKKSDAVINFAAESHVDRSINSASDFVQSNIVGVQVLLDGIKSNVNPIRFLQISTDEVYGSIKFGSWDEHCSIQPNSPYSASKASGELLAMAYQRTHSLDILITRSSNNYGTHHFPEKLIPLFITNLIEGKKLPIYGTGQNIRDWLHVDDHCRGIYKVLMKGQSGEIYNIGGGRELSNLEITKIILNLMNKDESSIEFISDRKGHDFRYSINSDKITRELGYTPHIKFEDGINETINWYRSNPHWWGKLKNNMTILSNFKE
jgi:dTDP-glucose 4,6-dehydratase